MKNEKQKSEEKKNCEAALLGWLDWVC